MEATNCRRFGIISRSRQLCSSAKNASKFALLAIAIWNCSSGSIRRSSPNDTGRSRISSTIHRSSSRSRCRRIRRPNPIRSLLPSSRCGSTTEASNIPRRKSDVAERWQYCGNTDRRKSFHEFCCRSSSRRSRSCSSL